MFSGGMVSGPLLIGIFILAIVVLLLLIIKFKLNAFVALLLTAFGTGGIGEHAAAGCGKYSYGRIRKYYGQYWYGNRLRCYAGKIHV